MVLCSPYLQFAPDQGFKGVKEEYFERCGKKGGRKVVVLGRCGECEVVRGLPEREREGVRRVGRIWGLLLMGSEGTDEGDE